MFHPAIASVWSDHLSFELGRDMEDVLRSYEGLKWTVGKWALLAGGTVLVLGLSPWALCYA